MHSSMKTEYEGARSNFSLHKSATIMLDKSNRKHENTHRLNAISVDSSRTYGHDKEGSYLTDYAYNKVTEQLSLSKACRGIRMDRHSYFVYTPDDLTQKHRHLPPRFFRLRTIKVIANCYLRCSCGFGNRNKIPCRHILYIVRKYHSFMFGIRWLKIFQFGFERKGYESLTSLFRKIEQIEFKRGINEEGCIYVHDLLNMNNNERYPTCLHNCTIINKNEMLLLKQGLDNNIVFVRGIKIEEQLSANIPNEENGAGAMVVNLSQDTDHMLLSDMEYEILNENDRTDS